MSLVWSLFIDYESDHARAARNNRCHSDDGDSPSSVTGLPLSAKTHPHTHWTRVHSALFTGLYLAEEWPSSAVR